MIVIPINREELMYDLQDEIARILNISFFDVEEISDEDLDMITGGIHGMVRNYAHALANRQLQNEVLYSKMTSSAQEEIKKIQKELNEQNRKRKKERNDRISES